MTRKDKIAQLVRQCQQCDRIAQKQLYLLYADDLMNLAIRYARDTFIAKDLVHDTFLKVFKNIHKYNAEKGSFKSWISRILINTALDLFNKQKREVFLTEDGFIGQIAPDFSIIQTLEAEDIIKLLQKLPEGARLVFNLYVIEGYKHDEIGEMLGITASASRSQLARSKHKLRQLIHQFSNLNISCADRKTG